MAVERSEQRWKQLEREMVCPIQPALCRRSEDIKRKEIFLGHDAIIIALSCDLCGKQVSGWGER